MGWTPRFCRRCLRAALPAPRRRPLSRAGGSFSLTEQALADAINIDGSEGGPGKRSKCAQARAWAGTPASPISMATGASRSCRINAGLRHPDTRATGSVPRGLRVSPLPFCHKEAPKSSSGLFFAGSPCLLRRRSAKWPHVLGGGRAGSLGLSWPCPFLLKESSTSAPRVGLSCTGRRPFAVYTCSLATSCASCPLAEELSVAGSSTGPQLCPAISVASCCSAVAASPL